MTDTQIEFVRDLRKFAISLAGFILLAGFVWADHYFNLGVIGSGVDEVESWFS